MGIELTHVLPHLNFLACCCPRVRMKTLGCGDMRAFYTWSPDHSDDVACTREWRRSFADAHVLGLEVFKDDIQRWKPNEQVRRVSCQVCAPYVSVPVYIRCRSVGSRRAFAHWLAPACGPCRSS
jgi:hypothetical protein